MWVARWVIAIAWIALTGQPVAAQPDDPRLVLNSEGPHSRVRGLAYSADSHRLYCGGFSKVVHVWDVGWNLRQGQPGRPQATPIRTLRWEIARALRGHINAMSLSTNRGRLAVGGTAARDPSGTIVIFDTDRNQVAAALPPVRDAAGRPGHRTSVIGLDFSPSGDRLLSVSLDGEVWLWTAPTEEQGDWNPRLIRPAAATTFDRQPVQFLTEDRFVAAERVRAGDDMQWRLALYSAAGERLRELPQTFGPRLNALAINTSRSRVATAAADGSVLLISTETFETIRELTAPGGQEPSALAYSPEGLIAVTRNDRPQGNSRLELWNDSTGVRLDDAALSARENGLACCFSPNGSQLATHDDESQDVLIYTLHSPSGDLQPKPLSGSSPLRLRGRGRVIERAQFEHSPVAEAPLRLGLDRDQDRRIESVFTPERALLERLAAEDPEFRGVEPDTFAGGWRIADVRQDAGRTQNLLLRSPTGAAHTITLDVTEQGAFRGVHCFIPDAAGRPAALALGTETQAGVFVYDLTGDEPALPLLRYFRDHTGDPTSLSVAPTGRYLLSSSQDQTVKLWSLSGLQSTTSFPASALWGAEFVVRQNQLVVAGVDPAGIAHRRNLRAGDRVAAITVSSPQGPLRLTDAAEMRTALAAISAASSVLIEATRDGRPLPPRIIVPGWEPMLSLFIDDRDEWAVFTPEGYYDASAAEGHRLFGWQINQGPGTTPRFEPAANLQKDFERPELIRELLRQGSVETALQSLRMEAPALLADRLAAVPAVQIVAPRQSEQFDMGALMPFTVRVAYTPSAPRVRFEVAAFHGGRALGAPQSTQAAGNVVTYQWSVPCDGPLNQLTTSVREAGVPITRALQQSETLYVRGRSTHDLSPPQVHVLAIGLEQYQPGTGLPKLQFAVDDVEDLVPRFSAERFRPRQVFAPGRHMVLLTDAHVSLTAIEQAVASIRQELASRPDSRRDLVLCHMCGHGAELDGEFYLHPTSLPSAADDVVRRQSIPWSRVCNQLNGLPCHVVWFIDACHSGAAVDAAKAIVREAHLPNRFVLAASQMNQLSYEDASYRVDDDDAGHGAFTMALLRGLDGPADAGRTGNSDGVITTSELAEYVRREVRNSTVRRQSPCYVPTSLAPLQTPGGEIPLLRSLVQ